MAIKDLNQVQIHLFLCNGGTCKKAGAEETTASIRKRIQELGLVGRVHTTKTMCNGRCEDGPIAIAMPSNVWYQKLSPDKAAKFVEWVIQRQIEWPGIRLFDYSSRIVHSDSKPDSE